MTEDVIKFGMVDYSKIRFWKSLYQSVSSILMSYHHKNDLNFLPFLSDSFKQYPLK